jgi:hypothetical protein
MVEKRRVRRTQQQLKDSRTEINVNGRILLSNIGDFDSARLGIAGAEVADAYITGGMFRIPGFLGLSVSGFKGTLTLHLGVGPTDLVTTIFEKMMTILPARRAKTDDKATTSV